MKMPTAFILLLAGLFVFAVAVNVRAAAVSASWTAPTQRADNTPLPASEIASYELRWSCGGEIGSTTSTTTNATVEITTPGICAFIVVAIDTGGRKSDPSNAVSVTIPSNAPPKPPTQLEVLLQRVTAMVRRLFGFWS